MKQYLLFNQDSGHELGIYRGETAGEAIAAMHADAGYSEGNPAPEDTGLRCEEVTVHETWVPLIEASGTEGECIYRALQELGDGDADEGRARADSGWWRALEVAIAAANPQHWVESEDLTMLGELCTRYENGKHFTEIYPDAWIERMEALGLIEVTRPVHFATGLSYGSEEWTVRASEKGLRLLEWRDS